MMGKNQFLYPMVAMGAGFVLFWVGFVLAYHAGLHAINCFVAGIACAWGAVSLVVEMERFDPEA